MTTNCSSKDIIILSLLLLLSTKVNEEPEKIGSTDVSKDKLPQCEKVDELSTTEKAESHTEANNATKDANELLHNYHLDQVTYQG